MMVACLDFKELSETAARRRKRVSVRVGRRHMFFNSWRVRDGYYGSIFSTRGLKLSLVLPRV